MFTRPQVPVLLGLDFEASPGQFVAIVGPSGSGKTTTISLIERFYDPLSGDILLDGQPVSSYHLNEYRNKISLVNQEPRFMQKGYRKAKDSLYEGTLRFNILLGIAEDVDQQELDQSCQDANV